MDFRPLNDSERRQLLTALRGNVEDNRILKLNRNDTSFAGTVEAIDDDEVLSAIQSIPCHY